VPSRRQFTEVQRQFERIHFEHPIPGRLGDAPVRVLDLAIGGARLLGSTKVVPGQPRELKIEWQGQTIHLKCVVTRCILQTFASEKDQVSTYDIGLRISEAVGQSDRVMREMVATFVMKALDEQRANWEGVPPVGPYVHVEGKTNRYRRCELLNGEWKITSTTRPEQPLTGFTVSAEVAPHYIDMLCKTYEATDDEGRRLTRILAELSINKAEGVPTRRYIP
jgi:PilZ domain